MMTAAMMVETCGSGVHWYVVYRLVFVLCPAIRVYIITVILYYKDKDKEGGKSG